MHDYTTKRTASAPSRPADATLLDFLYPEKTLALLKRFSSYGTNAAESRRRPLPRAAVRQFSTAQGQARLDEASADSEAVEEAKREMVGLLKESDPISELRKILRMRTPGKHELAWQLYSVSPEAEITLSMRKNLLEYLDDGKESTMPGRVLEIFNIVANRKPRPTSYRAAVRAYIALRMVGPAIQLIQDIEDSRNFDLLELGIDSILRRTVNDEQWDLSLRVFSLYMRDTFTTPRARTLLRIQNGDTLPGIWKEAASLPEFVEHFQSFFHHVREYQHELRSSQEREQNLACFITTLVPHVIDSILTPRKPDETYIWNYFLQLFDNLLALNLPTSGSYEYAIKQMLALPRYERYTNKRKIWLELYRRYRQRYVDQAVPDPQDRPSQDLIRQLIEHHGSHSGTKRISDHINDLRTFYPGQPLKSHLLRYLTHLFADLGDNTSVDEYFREFQANHKKKLDLRLLSALPFVHARRADVEETTAQFNRIQEEFGKTPNTSCWNTLILAYVRADDLDGALECFNKCIDSRIAPDRFTFGPLLDFCAHRGDIEAFESLFTRAKQMGVPLDTDVRARSGYVEAFLNAGDPEGAKAIAYEMLRSWQAGKLRDYPLTHTWNLLIQHHALNQDLESGRVCYRQMVENKIPLDSWTYGSLMRALVEVQQTNAAYKILRVTMPQNNLRVHAIHYAIVMAGFLKEGQIDLAVEVYERMVARQVPQTDSSRQASLRTLGTVDLQTLERRGAKHPNYRMLKVEAALQEMLVAGAGREVAHREPRHAVSVDTHNYGAVPQAYHGLLISLYTTRSAYAVCKKLFRKAQELAPDSDNYVTPIALTTAIMEAHLKAGKHAEVARSWQLARTSADKLTKTFGQLVQPKSAIPEVESLVDPSIQQRFAASQISNNRRHILAKPCRIYIRSLLAQSDPTALQKAQHTIGDLLVNGFTVDNFTWNELVQHLAQRRDNLVKAFEICEEYLMPRFPGWRNLTPGYVRRDRQGYQWMEIRHYEIKKTSVLPRYKTLIILARAFGQAKRDERNGSGYDFVEGAWTREILETAAPMTVRAIESMPRTNDVLQEKYFHNIA